MSGLRFSSTVDEDLRRVWVFHPEGDGEPVGGVYVGHEHDYGVPPFRFRPVKQNGSRLHLRLLTADDRDARYPESHEFLAGSFIERRAYTSDIRGGKYWSAES